jgi:hypothetical protein
VGTESTRPPASGPALVGVVALAVFAAIVRASRPLLSGTDSFWHYDLGRRIWDSGLPRTDPYSFLREGQEWILNQWGSEAVFGAVNALGGLRPLAVFTALLVGGAYLLVGWKIWTRTASLLAVPLLGLVVLASMSNWNLRGNLFTFLILPMFLGELLRADGPRAKIMLPLMIVWANLHAAFLLGAGLLAVHLVGRLVIDWPARREAVLRAAGLIVGGLLAGVVTPYGPAFLVSTLSLATRAGGAGISEWMPPPLTRIDVLPYTLLVAAVLVAVGLAARREDLANVLAIVAAALFGLSALRNLATASIVVAVVGAPYVQPAWASLRRRDTVARPRRPLAPFDRAMAAVVVVGGLIATAVLVPASGKVQDHLGDVPYDLITALAAEEREVRLVTTSSWSPAFAALTPESVKTAVDGRLELFSDVEIQTVRDLESANSGWQNTLRGWCTTDVVLPTVLPLEAVLRASPQWRLVRSVPTDSNGAAAQHYVKSSGCS